MRIECTIVREGGSFVDIDGVDYHFKPLTGERNSPHVAEVEDEDHIARFLAIREGYRIYNPNRKTKITKEAQAPLAQSPEDKTPEDDDKQPVVIPLPDSSLSKKELIAWIQENMPDLNFDAKMNVEAIRRAVLDSVQV